jgi:hypothetical protein
MKISFVGPTYPLVSKPASVQRTIGMYPVPIEPGNERTSWVFKDFPGLVEVEPFAATEIVLFLFHMTETATAEGIAEFIGGPTSALDQTGATWTSDSTDWVLLATFPYPVFGLFLLGGTGDITWSRDAPQTDPEIPDDYSTSAVSTLQIDGWFYVQSGSVAVNDRTSLAVGTFAYPLIAEFDLLVNDEFDALARFDDGSTSVEVFSADPIPTNIWVHLRLLYTGTALVLFVDGTLSAQTAATGLLELVNPINRMEMRQVGSAIYLEDCRASIGGSASAANFTPPVAPWPNP